MILAKAILNYDRSFIVLATVITIVNYDHKTLIVQATGRGIRSVPMANAKTNEFKTRQLTPKICTVQV